MTAKKGKYVWLERDYAEDEEDREEGSSKAKEPKEAEKIPKILFFNINSTVVSQLQKQL